MTVQALADRCEELGLPLGRVTITKLERGMRQAVTPGELMVLAVALRVSPVELLYDVKQPDKTTEILPGAGVSTASAALWFTGRYSPIETLTGAIAFTAPRDHAEETDIRLLESHIGLVEEWHARERAAADAALSARNERSRSARDALTELAAYARQVTTATERELAAVRAEMERRGFTLPRIGAELQHVDRLPSAVQMSFDLGLDEEEP